MLSLFTLESLHVHLSYFKFSNNSKILTIFESGSGTCLFSLCVLHFGMPCHFLLKVVCDVLDKSNCDKQVLRVRFYVYLARSEAVFIFAIVVGVKGYNFAWCPCFVFPVLSLVACSW